MNRIETARLGAICAKFRRSKKITQEQIADDLGCTVKAVSHFEHGRSTNMMFLLWYFAHGMLEWYYHEYGEGDVNGEEVRSVQGEDS